MRKMMFEKIGKTNGILQGKENALTTKQVVGIMYELLESLEKRLYEADTENGNLRNQIERLPSQEDYQTLKEGIKQIREICERDRDKARRELEQCEKDLETEKERGRTLQEKLNKLKDTLDKKESDAESLEKELLESREKADAIGSQNQQYKNKIQKMPKLMRLYDAYDAIMEKKDELPQKVIEWVPIDDFDSFLCRALKSSFPIGFYLAIESLIKNNSEQMSDRTMEEALHISDQLLAEVFSFGSEYFEEKGLFRISVEKGNPFNEELYIDIGGKGGMCENVARVWLHGLRDGKEDKIYHSYVEGE